MGERTGRVVLSIDDNVGHENAANCVMYVNIFRNVQGGSNMTGTICV